MYKKGEKSYKKYVELRDAKGITDSEIAESKGITKSTFSDWKSGRSRPGFEKLCAIAEYFDVPVELFKENQEE